MGDNEGAHVNGPTPVTGKVDGALSFDGVDDFVQVPDSSTYDLTDMTINAWIKTANAGSSYRRIISQQVGGSLAPGNCVLGYGA